MRLLTMLFLTAGLSVLTARSGAEDPSLPIGINLMWINYWAPTLMFNDVATTLGSGSPYVDAGGSFNAPGMRWSTRDDGSWTYSTGRTADFAFDADGYPLEVPITVWDADQGSVTVRVHANFNNRYPAGNYLILYDGDGEVHVKDPRNAGFSEIDNQPGRVLFYYPGNYDDKYAETGNSSFGDLEITRSARGNHVRNLHIVPERMEFTYRDSTFFAPYLAGLRPMHCLRFMQTQETIAQQWYDPSDFADKSYSPSTERTSFRGIRSWSDRNRTTSFSQSSDPARGGPAYEYLIQLCNEVRADAWFCMPHAADDDYLKRFAELVKDSLDPGLKVYIEYSNEIWNWSYPVSHWVNNSAPGAPDSIQTALNAIDVPGSGFAKKRAWLAQRMFRIWESVFTGSDRERLVTVMAVQHGWVGTSRTSLQWLKDNTPDGEKICDVVSPGGYFGLDTYWDTLAVMDSADVDAGLIIDYANAVYDSDAARKTLDHGDLATEFNVGYAVYEGGSHVDSRSKTAHLDRQFMDAVTDEGMYDLYRRSFSTHVDPRVECSIFVAFAYCKSDYWMHVPDPNVLTDWDRARADYPKWRALLDFNTSKSTTDMQSSPEHNESSEPRGSIRFYDADGYMHVTSFATGPLTVEVYTTDGNLCLKRTADTGGSLIIRKNMLPDGIYLIRATVTSGFSPVRAYKTMAVME